METLRRDVPTGTIEGTYDPAFASVVDEFAKNFAERGEVGASACVVVEGRTVVDVWGGLAQVADEEKGRAAVPWGRDTVSIVYSCTKGATALCLHVLASRGLVDIEAPVSQYWPEFAANGKAGVTVRMMLDHSAAVPVLRGPVEPGALFDWDHMVSRLEAEEPFWEPGTRNGYHMINFGWTVGEIVRRVSGRSLGTFFREEIAEPLGIDFWIGLPEEHEPRVAPMLPYVRAKGDPLGAFARLLLSDPASIPALAIANTATQAPNSRASHAAEIGGGGGISNARGLARMYTPLSLGGGSLVSPERAAAMGRVSMATNCDATLQLPTRFAEGFMVRMDNRAKPEKDSVIIGDGAFGHVGAGGSIGFADPRLGLAVGYSMNRMGPGILLNERGQSVVDAVYRCLEVS